MKAFSMDLRGRIVQAADAGQPLTEVARRFGVSRATVARYRRRAATGALTPKRHPGPRRRIAAAQEPALRAQQAALPDATLAEHCAAWARTQGVVVSEATMCRALARTGWTRKKSR
jgi:transposase